MTDGIEEQGAESPLSEEAKEKIQEEERYREGVRREIRRTSTGSLLVNRVLRMLKLEPGIFTEIATDPAATGQAAIVYVVAYCVGTATVAPFVNLFFVPIGFVFQLVVALLFSLVTRLFSEDVPPFPQWFRVMFFASAPAVFGIVPWIGSIVGAVYTIVLMIVATRDLARVSTGSAILCWLFVVLLPAIVFIAVLVTVVGGVIGTLGLDWLLNL